MDDLMHSCTGYIKFINYNKNTAIGIFDILRYIGQINYIFLNWIEVLPDKKGGKIQTIFLITLFPIFKLFNIKVVWTMHNKLAHSLQNVYWKKLIFKKLLKYANIILTHSSEGIIYGNQMVKGSESRIHYLPHPVKDRRLNKQNEKEYDILIWGTISPFKGIDKFLDFIYRNNVQNSYKILIIGKTRTEEYGKNLEKYKSEKILIENKFIEDELLQELISKSKLVLFTYSQTSVLSSGVLMDSLGYGARIIGPDTGAFADLAKEGIINTYTDFRDMFKIIDKQLNGGNKTDAIEKSEKFLEDNSWDKFAENLANLLDSKK